MPVGCRFVLRSSQLAVLRYPDRLYIHCTRAHPASTDEIDVARFMLEGPNLNGIWVDWKETLYRILRQRNGSLAWVDPNATPPNTRISYYYAPAATLGLSSFFFGQVQGQPGYDIRQPLLYPPPLQTNPNSPRRPARGFSARARCKLLGAYSFCVYLVGRRIGARRDVLATPRAASAGAVVGQAVRDSFFRRA